MMGGRWPYSWCLVGCCCQGSEEIYLGDIFPDHLDKTDLYLLFSLLNTFSLALPSVRIFFLLARLYDIS